MDELLQLRPYPYHLTAQSNVASISSNGELTCAKDLLELAGKERLLRTRRAQAVRLVVNGLALALRDQEPLHAGNMELQHGWILGEVVLMLNKRWPVWHRFGASLPC
ncbi:MAG: hypothetical protein P4L46_03475 [Fimbriimonas sp.]|nr:hypothetical protein [Fimbriimonas sp.]